MLNMIKTFQNTHSIIVISYTIGDLLPKLGGLRAAVIIHRDFLKTILRLPMTFFYVNPRGRILSRCSKDINVVDQPLPRQLDSFAYFVIQVNRRWFIMLMVEESILD
jgi:hypothetical protein